LATEGKGGVQGSDREGPAADDTTDRALKEVKGKHEDAETVISMT
jgi:hypothetical protein